MKKIICTVTNDLTFDQRMIRICGSLSREGYQVHLVGRQLDISVPLQQAPFRQTRMQVWFQKGKLFYIEYNIRLFLFLLTHPFDIVCSVDLDTLLPGFVVASIRKKICVYDAHEYFTEVPEVVNRKAVKWIWEKLAGWLIPRVDAAYTVSESLAVVLEERYGTPFSVIRNMPFRNTASAEAQSLSTEPFVLIYQGVLNEGRGLEEVIEALRTLNDVVCWIAGEGDLSDDLRRLVKSYQLEERVQFLGRVKPEELRKLTSRAHVGLNLLKHKGLNYYYSLANKAFDYIQAGIPSLCMDFPEYRRLNDRFQTFELLEDLETNSIVKAICHLKDDPSFYQALKRNCGEAAQHLNWEHEENTLRQLYKALSLRDDGPVNQRGSQA